MNSFKQFNSVQDIQLQMVNIAIGDPSVGQLWAVEVLLSDSSRVYLAYSPEELAEVNEAKFLLDLASGLRVITL